MTTILTLKLDAAAQATFEALRQQHYPAELNRIAAHLTLFHTLPATDDIRQSLLRETQSLQRFPLRVASLRSLGRGVAYFLEGPGLLQLHGRLAAEFDAELSPQDRQGFRPHVVVQNKVAAEQARSLLAQLSAGFQPWEATAVGLQWWEYLGGPWRLIEDLPFNVARP